MADVFISYSRRDQTFVRQLFGVVEQAGKDAWVDWEDIPLTTDWWAEIRAGIEGAQTFLFIMTPESLASPVCTLEVAHALALNKRIIPLLPIPFDHASALAKLAARPTDSALSQMAAGRSLADIAQTNWQAVAAINWVQFADHEFDSVARQLVAALDTDYEHAKTHTRLLQRTLEWERAGKPTALLLRGDAQREAEAWAQYNADKIPKPTDTQREYIAAGVRLRATEITRLRLTIGVLAVLLILSIGASAIAVNRTQLAESNAATAEANLRAQWDTQALFLADQSRQTLLNTSDSQASLLIALEGVEHYDDGVYRSEAQQALMRALSSPMQAEHVFEHGKPIFDIALSPDNTRLATSDNNGGVRVWDMTTGAELAYAAPTPTGYQANFGFYPGGDPPDPDSFGVSLTWSPDGKTLLLGEPFSAILWDWQTGAETRLTIPETTLAELDTYRQAEWSADGTRILYWSTDSQAVVWDWENVPNNPQAFTLPDPSAISIGITSAAWSADGQAVGFTSTRGSFIWTPGQDPWRISGGWLLWHPTQPDKVLTWNTNQLPTLWTLDFAAQTADRTRTYGSPTAFPARIAFNDDGTRLVVISPAQSALTEWDVETGDSISEVEIPAIESMTSQNIPLIGYTGDGTHIRLMTDDGRGWIYRPSDAALFPYTFDELNAISLSPDNQTTAIMTSYDLRFYPLSSEATAPTNGLAVSETGFHQVIWVDSSRVLVRGMGDNARIDLWRVNTPHQPIKAVTPDLSAEQVWACGADGALVFDSAAAHYVRLSDGESHILGRRDEANPVSNMACDSAGKYAAVWGYNGMPTLWDIAADSAVSLPYPADLPQGLSPQAVTFSPDGTQLAMTVSDYTQDWLVVFSLDNLTAAKIYPDVIALGSLVWQPQGQAVSMVGGAVVRVNLTDDSTRFEYIGTYASDGGWSADGQSFYVYDSASMGTVASFSVFSIPQGDGSPAQILEMSFPNADQLVLPRITAFDPEGRFFAAAFATEVWLWDLQTGDAPRRYPAPAQTQQILFHPSGRLLLLGAEAHVVDIASAETVIINNFLDPALAFWSADSSRVIAFQQGEADTLSGFAFWTVDIPALIDIGRAAAVRTLTSAERIALFLPPNP